MSIPGFLRRATYLVAAVMFCLLFLPRPAAADNTDIVNLTFSGTATCIDSPCSGTAVTGTYSVDTTNGGDFIVGDWSFTTPLGTFSGVGCDPNTSSCTPYQLTYPESIAPQGFASTTDGIDFTTDSGILQLAFDSSQPFDGTLITSPDSSIYGYAPSLGVDLTTGGLFYLTSGSSSVVATPEPSSIALLGLGLFGLFILRRKRMSARVRAAA